MSFPEVMSLVASLLQFIVAGYALRLNRIFGTARVGWSLFWAFSLLALLHFIQSVTSFNNGVFMGAEIEVIYALIALLLLTGLIHLETLLRERRRVEQEEKRMRDGLELLVNDKTAHLTKAIQDLQLEIADRKQTEEALATEQRLLNSLITATPDLIYFKDRESRFIRVNNAFVRRNALSDPSAVLGKTDFDLFGEQHARQAYEDEQQIMATGQPMIGKEEREDWKDGHVTWVTSTKMPLRDTAGNIVGIMGTSRDITERKLAEEALLLSQQRLALHVEQTPLAVIQWDSDFKVQEWNPAAEKVFGYTREEAVGRHFSFFTSDSARPQVEAVGQTLMKQGGSRQSTNENITKAGKNIICEWYNTALVDPAGRFMGVASLVQDITERKQAEQKLAETLDFNQKIISDASAGILVYKASGQCVLANEAAARTVNGTVPQLLNQNFRELVSWHASGLLKTAELALATGKPQQFETHFVSSFGKDILAGVSLHPLCAGQ